MYTLYHGDCLDKMREIADQSVDAVITDIPSGRTACVWDSVIPLVAMWTQLKRVTKPKGAIVLLGLTQPFTSMVIASNQKQFRHHWIWHKSKATNYVKARHMPMRYHEDIAVFSDGAVNYTPQMRSGKGWRRIHRNGNKSGSIIQDTRKDGHETIAQMLFPSSVLFFPVAPKKLHPTEKPQPLLEYLIKTYTNAGDTVLDFCMGSGSTGHACANTGRNFIGCELYPMAGPIDPKTNPDYFHIASERIAAAYAPLACMERAS